MRNGFRTVKISLFILLLSAAPVHATLGANSSAQTNFTPSTTTYCTPDGNPLLMDIYKPTNVSQPAPVVIYVHGGGWIGGSRTSDIDNVRIIQREVAGLLNNGFVVASIDYRLGQFPAMIEDVKCSIRYLRANAAQYNIDPTRIGVMGASAGGHLSALAGLAGENVGWDTGEYSSQSSRVNAVVDISGPTDLTTLNPTIVRAGFKTLNRNFLEEASPINYISSRPHTDPPLLIIHGEKDNVVPLSQAVRFYNKLRRKGQTANLRVVHNANHGIASVNNKNNEQSKKGNKDINQANSQDSLIKKQIIPVKTAVNSVIIKFFIKNL